MASNDNGLMVNLYGSSVTNAKVGGGIDVVLSEQTDYPFEEVIRFDLKTAQDVNFPLYLRVPAWCKGAAVSINGKKSSVKATEPGYLCIERTWKDGDKVELTLPMQVGLREWAINKNSVSVDYGPLTFSLLIDEDYQVQASDMTALNDSKWQENADVTKWPSYEIYPASAWNYGLYMDKSDPLKSFKVERRAFPADNYPFSNENAPIVIHAKGKILPQWKIDQYGLCGVLPQSPVTTAEPVQDITLVPMGGARLRISAFPTVE